MSNLEVIKKGYAYFAVGDMAGWSSLVHDNAEWVMPGSLPASGTFVGPENIIQNCFMKIMPLFPNMAIEIKGIYESGDTAFVNVMVTADDLEAEAVHMMKMVDGKFAYFRAFNDTEKMKAAAKI
jgi:ketosteroid isomerase-like protein